MGTFGVQRSAARAVGLEGRCFPRRKVCGGHVQRPREPQATPLQRPPILWTCQPGSRGSASRGWKPMLPW
jgi:hypothetical protein